jgi:hypothetical protein
MQACLHRNSLQNCNVCKKMFYQTMIESDSQLLLYKTIILLFLKELFQTLILFFFMQASITCYAHKALLKNILYLEN